MEIDDFNRIVSSNDGENWTCTFLFPGGHPANHAPNSSRLRSVTSDLMDSQIPLFDLIQYLQPPEICVARDDTFPSNSSFRFDAVGLEDKKKLIRQLQDAAFQNGFSLSLRNTVNTTKSISNASDVEKGSEDMKSDNKDSPIQNKVIGVPKKKNKQSKVSVASFDLICRKNRLYKATKQSDFNDTVMKAGVRTQLLKGRHKPKSRSLKDQRKTTTSLCLQEKKRCPFFIHVFLYIKDMRWYLRQQISKKDAKGTCGLHCNHPFIPPNLMTHSVTILSSDQKDTISRMHQSGASSAVIASYLSHATSISWNDQQMTNVINSLCANESDTNQTIADKLMNFLCQRNDISYIALCDEATNDSAHSNLIVLRGKGRPSTQVNLELNSYDTFRRTMNITANKKILLAVAFASDDECLRLRMFPEVLICDVTMSTNKEKRPLLQFVVKDSNRKIHTVLRVFMPSEQEWIFTKIFKDFLPSIVGHTTVSRIKCVLTDGDSNMFSGLDSMSKDPSSPWFGVQHNLCAYHRCELSWKKDVNPIVLKAISAKATVDLIYKWCKSWFYDLESEMELSNSFERLLKYLESVEIRLKIGADATDRIKAYVTKLMGDKEKWAFYTRMFLNSYEEMTTSSVENANSSLKRGSIRVKPCMGLDVSLATCVKASDRRIVLNDVSMTKTMSRDNLWSRAPTKDYLVSFAEGIVCQNITDISHYFCCRVTATEWWVLHKEIEKTVPLAREMPHFRRLRKVTLRQ